MPDSAPHDGAIPPPGTSAAGEAGPEWPSLRSGLPEGRPPRILVAEDHPDNQRFATRILEASGARVDIAPDGRTAIELAATTRYDLILMDLQMPVLDGADAAVAIRSAERLRDDDPVPIVAFTAHDVDGSRERCLKAGMNGYIVKPIGPNRLLEMVQCWIDARPVVLVADDSPQILRLVKRSLRDQFRVVTASNGREALDRFSRQHVSVVLLDMDMPVMNGQDTAAAIRLREDGRHVPIVALTGDDVDGGRERALAAGCTMHVPKPVNLATLASTVASAMRQADGPAGTDTAPGSHAAPIVIDVDPIVADLVPSYIRHTRGQLDDIRRLVAAGQMDHVRRIGHDLKGTGAAYGIPDVTRLGRELETAGKDDDASRATLLVDELDTLLQRAAQQLGDLG